MSGNEAEDAVAPIVDDPFYVLAIPVDASRAVIEREGQKLLDQLELGVARAKFYGTPLGPRPRSIEKVRKAMAELRDPMKRLVHEAWARVPIADELPADEALAPAEDAFEAMGF